MTMRPLCISALLLVFGPMVVSHTEPRVGGLDVLRNLVSLNADEVAAIDRGEPVVKTLDAQEKREVAIVAVAWVRAPKECFVEKVKDIEHFKKNPAVLQIGKFQNPAQKRDLDRLTLDADELSALRSCRVGNCSVKLPAITIERLRREVNWSAPDHAQRALSVIREDLLNDIRSYLAAGNSGLIEYRDKSKAVRLADELQSLLGSWPDRDQSIQAFRQYVAEYPRKPLPDVEDFLYWSKEHVGRKPVVSITHVAIHHRPDRIFIASKQIYASHYFDGSLGLTVAADPDNPTRRGMYLAYVNRSRIDALGGMFGGFLRAILRSRLREGVRKNLQQTVAQVESACDGNRTVPALAPLQKEIREGATH